MVLHNIAHCLLTTTQTQDQMESGLLLDVVVSQSAAVLKLLSGKDQTLLVRGNALLVLNLGLDIVNGVAGLHLQSDGLASEGLDKDLHASTQTQDQVECGLLLDVVVSQGAAILKLLAGKDQTLLVRGDTCKGKSYMRHVLTSPMFYWLPMLRSCSDSHSSTGPNGKDRHKGQMQTMLACSKSFRFICCFDQ